MNVITRTVVWTLLREELWYVLLYVIEEAEGWQSRLTMAALWEARHDRT